MRSEILEINRTLIDTNGLSERLSDKLKETAKHLDINFKELETQKVLSISDEGMISTPINKYTVGFQMGLQQYLEV